MAILVLAFAGALLCIFRLRYVISLAQSIAPRTVLGTCLGTALQLLGLALGGVVGHALVVTGLAALLRSATDIWRWPGGKLLWVGLCLNAIAMATYGRMPVTPEVVQGLGQARAAGTIIEGSKNLVAQGWVASVLGDRFITHITSLDYYTVWSAGDFIILCGFARIITGELNDEQ